MLLVGFERRIQAFSVDQQQQHRQQQNSFSSPAVNWLTNNNKIKHHLHPFSGTRKQTKYSSSLVVQHARQKEDQADTSTKDTKMNPLTKSSWYVVEWFGNTFGSSSSTSNKEDTTTDIDLTMPPKSLKETLQRIQADNDRSYFLSGQVDEQIYDPNCIFRDPFVSFQGRERFVTNLANLGSFITKYSAKVLQYSQPNETTIETKIMVKLELNLPWKPILAWPWGVKFTIDPSTYLITDHEESWDIDAWEGVKQIFRKPTLKL